MFLFSVRNRKLIKVNKNIKILVTGASRGIGEAIAHHFARLGYTIILVARTENDLKRVKKDIISNGGNADYIVSDLSIPENAKNLADLVNRKFGFVEYLVLNAGVSKNSEFLKITSEDFLEELNTNYIAPLFLIKGFLGFMTEKKKGKIVTISSIAGTLPFPGNASYAASKSALISICTTMHIELKKYGIYIGSVLPGLTRTEMTKDFNNLPLPFMSPDEIAQSVEEAFQSEKILVVPGFINNFLTNIYKHFPLPINSLLELFVDYIKIEKNK